MNNITRSYLPSSPSAESVSSSVHLYRLIGSQFSSLAAELAWVNSYKRDLRIGRAVVGKQGRRRVARR